MKLRNTLSSILTATLFVATYSITAQAAELVKAEPINKAEIKHFAALNIAQSIDLMPLNIETVQESVQTMIIAKIDISYKKKQQITKATVVAE